MRLLSADDLDWAAALRQYDSYVFCMGNSSFHAHVFDALRARRGLVLAHDVRMIGFWTTQAMRESPENPWGLLAHWLRLAYEPRIDASVFADRPPSPYEQTALGLFLTEKIQERADHLVVHSGFAADVLRLDRPPERGDFAPISVLPLALEVQPERPRPERPEAPVIASFGVLSEVKGLATLIDAFAVVAASRPGARLILAGPADDAGARALAAVRCRRRGRGPSADPRLRRARRLQAPVGRGHDRRAAAARSRRARPPPP